MATESAVFIVGIMMLMVGVFEIIAVFGVRTWGRFLLWLLLGALYVFAGFACLNNPFVAATLLTLMLGIALIVGGLVRIFLATQMKHGTPWGWVVFSGILSFLLGLMIVGPLAGLEFLHPRHLSRHRPDLHRRRLADHGPGPQETGLVVQIRLSPRRLDGRLVLEVCARKAARRGA